MLHKNTVTNAWNIYFGPHVEKRITQSTQENMSYSRIEINLRSMIYAKKIDWWNVQMKISEVENNNLIEKYEDCSLCFWPKNEDTII